MSESWVDLIEKALKEHGKRLLAFIRRRTSNPQVADDVFQTVVTRMLDKDRSGEIENLPGYMYTVAHNAVIEQNSEERRWRGTADIDDPGVQDQLVVAPDPGAQIDIERRIARLREVLLGLPVRWLTAVVMCHMHNLSRQQAATRLGVSENSIKKYLKKALARCRCQMADLR